MPRDGRFWRNVAMIAVAHVAIAIALVGWSRGARTPDSASIVWMSDALGTAPPSKAPTERTESSSSPTAAPRLTSSLHEEEEKSSNATPSKSEIQLPVPTASPTPISKNANTETGGDVCPEGHPEKNGDPDSKTDTKENDEGQADTGTHTEESSQGVRSTEKNRRERKGKKFSET